MRSKGFAAKMAAKGVLLKRGGSRFILYVSLLDVVFTINNLQQHQKLVGTA